MEVIHKVVRIGSDRELTITLPDSVTPGLVEVVVVVQPLPVEAEDEEGRNLAESGFSDYLSNLEDYEERLAQGENE